MGEDLVGQLLPTLSRSLEKSFNVFDVMHHGSHEKQISNVFRWLLDAQGSHGLGEAVVEILAEEVNRARVGLKALPTGGYAVRQEVNVAEPSDPMDIADLVLESDPATIVIENYFTSDGHGHGYEAYLQYALCRSRLGVVVLLCHEMDSSRLADRWDEATVITYRALLEPLHQALDANRKYQRQNPEAFSFIDQMHRKFVTGSAPMEDHKLLEFLVAMCETGEAARYSRNDPRNDPDRVAEQFASYMHEQARERFGEGRKLLQRTKDLLKSFCSGVLTGQLEAAKGESLVQKVDASLRGKWQWAVIVHLQPSTGGGADSVRIVFGPTAWHTQEERAAHPVDNPDYSHVFLWRRSTKEFRQSEVSLQEVLDGLDREDTRLRDEVLDLLSAQ